jgi:uncharacterized membrane protein YbhN (UPF0104 family)
LRVTSPNQHDPKAGNLPSASDASGLHWMLGLAWAPFRWLLILWRNPWVTGTVSLIVFAIALQVIGREVTQETAPEIQGAVSSIGLWTVLGALVMAVVSYTGLALNDRYALAMLDKPVSMRRSVRASVTAYALAKGLGYSWATAGTARQRLYSRWGLDPYEIGALSALTGIAVPLAGISVAGLGLALGGAIDLDGAGRLPFEVWMLVALCCLMPAAFWASFLVLGPKQFKIGPTPVSVPSLKSGICHLGAVMLDRIGAATALYLLLPDHGGWSYPAFLAVFVLAGLLGVLSGTPGGLGVFEAVILALAPVSQDAPGTAVALLVYRLIYTVLPLVLATAILIYEHTGPAVAPASRVARRLGARVPGQAHRILSLTVFGAGLMVLLSVATPAARVRLDLLERIDFGTISDIAHLCAAVLAVAIMAWAGGLWRDIANSWKPIVALLIAGSIACCLKGLDWEEALLLALVAASVLILRGLLDSPELDARGRQRATVTVRWWYLVAGSVVAASTLANFAHPELSRLSTWPGQFLADTEAGRVGRALIAVAVLVAALGALAWRQQQTGRELPVLTKGEIEERKKVLAAAGIARPDIALARETGWQAVAVPGSPAIVLVHPGEGRLLIWADLIPGPDAMPLSEVKTPSIYQFAIALAEDRGLDAVFTGCSPRAGAALSELGLTLYATASLATISLQPAEAWGKSVGLVASLERLDHAPPELSELAWISPPKGRAWSNTVFIVRSEQGQIVAVSPVWSAGAGTRPEPKAAMIPWIVVDPAVDTEILRTTALTAIATCLAVEGWTSLSFAAGPKAGDWPHTAFDLWVEEGQSAPLRPVCDPVPIQAVFGPAVTLVEQAIAIENDGALLALLDLGYAGVGESRAPSRP